MKAAPQLIILSSLAALLAGCGGGGDTNVTVVAPSSQFIVWPGNSGGTQVIDGLGHTFAFYSDTGCLYNSQTGRENSAFCLVSGSNVVTYGPFHGQVENIVASDGTCRSAIIDQITGNFIDIETDVYGREVVATTSLYPAFCAR
ncbi:hypothetical protein HAV22_29640 [Massilia sp. TW-1]|uniref:Lipoprotein n=1 Tax=Telluria antibiotica TaxID=2717319 RepID=A0ABX0PKC9_9BURK|nr:hypothetical protein [Telluria antibiotica]NIA57796.1 hypothetical protein [Telluria antibiotica]